MKLFRVSLRGMKYSSTGAVYGISYVIAKDSNEAYLKVKKFLDDEDIGYSKDRVLDTVELLADENRYSEVNTLLFL